jgi:hypothetical protein
MFNNISQYYVIILLVILVIIFLLLPKEEFSNTSAAAMFKTTTDWNASENNTLNYSQNVTCNSNGIRAEIRINNVIYRFCYIPTTLPTTVTNFTNNDFKTYFLIDPNVSNVVFYYNNMTVDQYGASMMFKTITDWNITCNSNAKLRAEIRINNVTYHFCYIPTTLLTTVTNFTNNDFKTYFLNNPNAPNVLFYYNGMTIEEYGIAISMFKTTSDWKFTKNNTCNTNDNLRAEINMNSGTYRFCYIHTTLPTTVTNFTNNDFKTYFLNNPNAPNVLFYYNNINIDQYGIAISMFKTITDWKFTENNTCNSNGNLRAEIRINNVICRFCYIPRALPTTVTNFTNNDFKTYFLKNPNAPDVLFYYNNMTVDQYGVSMMFKNITDWNFIQNNTCNSNGNLRAEIRINTVMYRFCYIPTSLPTTVTNFTNNDFKTYFLKNPNAPDVLFYYNNINLDQYEAKNMFKTINDWSVIQKNTCNAIGNLKAEITINNVIYPFCYIPSRLPTTVTNFTNNDFKNYFLKNPNESNIVFYYNNINIDQYGAAIMMFKTITDWNFIGNNECISNGNLKAEITFNNIIYRFCYIPTSLPTTVTNFTNNDFKNYFLKNPNESNIVFYYNNINIDQYGAAASMFKTTSDWKLTQTGTCNLLGNIRAEINFNGVIYRFCYIPTSLPTDLTNFTNSGFKSYFLSNSNVSNVVFYYSNINIDLYEPAISMFKNRNEWQITPYNTCNSSDKFRAQIKINNVIYRFCYIPTSLPTTVTNFTNNDFKTYFLKNPNAPDVLFYYNYVSVDKIGTVSNMFKTITDWNFIGNNGCNSNGNLKAEIRIGNDMYHFCYMPTSLPTTLTKITNNDFKTYFLTNPNVSNVEFYYNNLTLDVYASTIVFKNKDDWVYNRYSSEYKIRVVVAFNSIAYPFYLKSTIDIPSNFTNNEFKSYFLTNPNVSNVEFDYIHKNNFIPIEQYKASNMFKKTSEWTFSKGCGAIELKAEINIDNTIYRFCYIHSILPDINFTNNDFKNYFLTDPNVSNVMFYYNWITIDEYGAKHPKPTTNNQPKPKNDNQPKPKNDNQTKLTNYNQKKLTTDNQTKLTTDNQTKPTTDY